MDERAKKITEAGIVVISRYGVTRVTVDDVAQEAEVSRQTVYNAFANRTALLAAIVRRHWELKWEAIDAAYKDAPDLPCALDILLEKLIVEPWETMEIMPNAKEFMIELMTTLSDEMKEVQTYSTEKLRDCLAPYSCSLESHDLTPDALADYIHRSIASMAPGIHDRYQMLSFVATMKALMLCVLTSAPAKRAA